MKKTIASLIIVLTSAVGVRHVVGTDQTKPRPDAAVERCIVNKLATAPVFKADHIAVKVSAGKAVLTGQVEVAGHKIRATEIARACGATTVTWDAVRVALNTSPDGLGTDQVRSRGGSARGLTIAPGGQIVDDSNLNVHWMANANLAGDAAARQKMGVAGILPNGMMDYATALKWVAALNAYDHGIGWLGHNNWQLPAAPMLDSTCGAQGPQGRRLAPCAKITLWEACTM